jgi:hypothetical protein
MAYTPLHPKTAADCSRKQQGTSLQTSWEKAKLLAAPLTSNQTHMDHMYKSKDGMYRQNLYLSCTTEPRYTAAGTGF